MVGASVLNEPPPPTRPDDRDTLNGPKHHDAIPYERRAAQRRALEEPPMVGCNGSGTRSEVHSLSRKFSQ